jgi:hypothetical protein
MLPAPTSIHAFSVCAEQPVFAEIETIVAHRDECS